MNDNRLLPDDPNLTAYALGELTGDERAAVEAALRENPALRVTVDEIRATVAHLQSALASEPIFASPPMDVSRAGIVIELNGHAAGAAAAQAAADQKSPTNGRHASAALEDAYQRPRSKLLRFPQFYYLVGTAAAACFAVLVALRGPSPAPVPAPKSTERPVHRELALAPMENLKPSETAPSGTPATAGEPARVIVANIPSAPSEVAAPVTSATEHASGSNAAPIAPAFVQSDLSLIGQTAPAPEPRLTAQAGTPNDKVTFSMESAIPREGAIGQVTATGNGSERATTLPSSTSPVLSKIVAGSQPGAGKDARQVARLDGGQAVNGTGASEPSARGAAASLFYDSLTPPPMAPVVASSASPAVVPNGASGRVAATSSAGEIVVLDAFMVTGDPAVGFSALGAQARASDKRKVARRDDLPSPPPGVKLVKNTEAYAYVRDNDFLSAAQNRLSTFAVDVDTASYANVRRILRHGAAPPRDAVRIEEMVNYFPYHYAPPRDDQPFSASLEVADAPWATTHRLVRIGLKARDVPEAKRPAANLVFLLDVSGSMNQPNKLPLVQHAMRLLVGKLKAEDRVAIVTYAGNSGLALPSTPVTQSREILHALDALTPGGSTNGAMGIELAYEIAKANFVRDGINRVILCTDGDFNVGTTSEGELVRLIGEKATSGVFLTVLGFGMGNYKDATLEKLADKGNGNYGYIDTRREAEKVLVEQVSSTLVTVAKDVKIQVEFNPATVSSYRLIGYENRLLRKEDFNDDKVDAGEVGAGHTITALYEIVPVGVANTAVGPAFVDELKYAPRGVVSSRLEMPSGKRDPLANELLTVRLRYKKPDSFLSFPKTLEFPLVNTTTPFAQASADFRFAAAVAQFGMILRGSPYRGTATLQDVATWATTATTPADDPGGHRGEFIELVRKAQALTE